MSADAAPPQQQQQQQQQGSSPLDDVVGEIDNDGGPLDTTGYVRPGTLSTGYVNNVLTQSDVAALKEKRYREGYITTLRELAKKDGNIEIYRFGEVVVNLWHAKGGSLTEDPLLAPTTFYKKSTSLRDINLLSYEGLTLKDLDNATVAVGDTPRALVQNGLDACLMRGLGQHGKNGSVEGDWDTVTADGGAFLNHTMFPAVRRGDRQIDIVAYRVFYGSHKPGDGIGPKDAEWEKYLPANRATDGAGDYRVNIDTSLFKGANAALMLKAALNGCNPKPGSWIWVKPILPDSATSGKLGVGFWAVSGASFGLALMACIMGGASILYTGSYSYIEPEHVIAAGLYRDRANNVDLSNPDAYYRFDQRSGPRAPVQAVTAGTDRVEPVNEIILKVFFATELDVPIMIPYRDNYGRPMSLVLAELARSAQRLQYLMVKGAYSDQQRMAGKTPIAAGTRIGVCNDLNDALRIGYYMAGSWLMDKDTFKLPSAQRIAAGEAYDSAELQGLVQQKQQKEIKARLDYEKRFKQAKEAKYGKKKITARERATIHVKPKPRAPKLTEQQREARAKAKSAASTAMRKKGVTRANIRKRIAYTGDAMLHRKGFAAHEARLKKAIQDLADAKTPSEQFVAQKEINSAKQAIASLTDQLTSRQQDRDAQDYSHRTWEAPEERRARLEKDISEGKESAGYTARGAKKLSAALQKAREEAQELTGAKKRIVENLPTRQFKPLGSYATRLANLQQPRSAPADTTSSAQPQPAATLPPPLSRVGRTARADRDEADEDLI